MRKQRRNLLLPAALGAMVLLVGSSAPAFANPPPRFAHGSIWHRNISAAAVDTNSTLMINTLQGLGGWGLGGMQIDFSIHVMHTAPGGPTQPVINHHAYGYFSPDCDVPAGFRFPIPVGGAIEGETGYTCDNENNDCHLLVVQGEKLFEAYSTTLTASGLESLCAIEWNLRSVYPIEGRGDHCTSADAAGFPMAPLLVNADEVAAAAGTPGSDLGHAIRFVLPNSRMANNPALGGEGGRLYVHPASHAGSPSGPVNSVPYGARLRLSPSFNMTGYDAAAQVILRTMQRYGIVLSDGGNVALTFESDRFTTAKWADMGIISHSFRNGANGSTPVLVTHFEVLDTGPQIGETWECDLNGHIFGDNFD